MLAFEVDKTDDGPFDESGDVSAFAWHDALYSTVAVFDAKSSPVGGFGDGALNRP